MAARNCQTLNGAIRPQSLRWAKGKRIGIIISGGNVNLERLCSLVAARALTRCPAGAKLTQGSAVM
jgi:threonine dehydratase